MKEKSAFWTEEQEQAAERIQEQLTDLKLQIDELEESLKSSIEKDLKDLTESIESKEQEIQELDEAIAKFDELKEHLKELQSSESEVSSAIRTTTRKIEDYQSDNAGYERKIARLEKDTDSLRSKLSENESTIGTPCPVCGRPLEAEHVQAAIEEIQSSIESNDSDIADYQKSIQSNNKKVSKLQANLSEYQELLEEVEEAIADTESDLEENNSAEASRRELAKELRALETSKLKKEKLKSQVAAKIESLQSQVNFYSKKFDDTAVQENPYEAQLQSESAKITEFMSEKELLNSEIAGFQNKMEVLQFWLKGFSNSGIKSMLLDDITPFLNERANKYLQVLSGNHVHVEFSTQTPLKSGELREKFQIRVMNEDGGDSYTSNSSGEKRRIDVAINLALQDLIASRANKKLNIMFADEIFDSLDSVGIDSVMSLLKMFADERSSIFVVSHNIELQSEFEKQLIVTKVGGCSSISYS
jgi:DNA repair exonuclease SbcCD ATPase subunit